MAILGCFLAFLSKKIILIVMVKKEKLEHQNIFKKSIQHLEATGFNNIKADIPGYENPKSFVRKSTGMEVTPDISATKNGRKYFFDISLKSDRSSQLKSKWLLLDAFSRLRSNRFKIITMRGHFKFTEQLLNEINLTNKQPIKI